LTPESVAQFFLIYEPAVYTIQHNPARHYNRDETGITIVEHKYTKILGLKGKRQISSVQSADRGSLVVKCLSPTEQFIPPLLVFPRTYMKQELMNGTLPTSSPRVPSLEVDTKRDFYPVFSSVHQTYKANKIRSCYLSTGRELFTHNKHGGH